MGQHQGYYRFSLVKLNLRRQEMMQSAVIRLVFSCMYPLQDLKKQAKCILRQEHINHKKQPLFSAQIQGRRHCSNLYTPTLCEKKLAEQIHWDYNPQ